MSRPVAGRGATRTGPTPTWSRTTARYALFAVVMLTVWAAQASAQSTDGVRSTDRRVVLVTGSTDGLGREVALRLAAMGSHVIIHGRNVERGEEVVARIEADGRGSARFYRADFASLDSVRAFGQTIERDYDRLDLLINNAGILLFGEDERRLSPDGHELHFAVNYLSGFLLTHMLLPLLERSAPSRIVNVASIGQAPLDFDDLVLDRGYSVNRAYGQSKLAQIMFTIDLAARLEGTGVTAGSLHPATFMNTSMITEPGLRPRSTVEEGAEAVLWVATSDDLPSGQFFNQKTPARANAQAYDAAARARLSELSARLTGIGAP